MVRQRVLYSLALIGVVGCSGGSAGSGSVPSTASNVTTGSGSRLHTTNVLNGSTATVSCTGYTVTIATQFLSPNTTYDITYSLTFTPANGGSATTVPGKIEFNSGNSTTSTQTASGKLNLVGNNTVTGSATLVQSGSTQTITFGSSNATSTTLTCPSYTCTKSISSNFNDNKIPPGSYIWFNSVFSPKTSGAYSFTLADSTISFGGRTVTAPGATITFSPNNTTATTSFANGAWNTQLPTSHLAGNSFLTGAIVPAASGPPMGSKNITWTFAFASNTPNIMFNYQWAAQVYSPFTTDYNALGVKPVDDNAASSYRNSDHAGTPENFLHDIVGAGTGGGGSNYTGSYSGTASCSLI